MFTASQVVAHLVGDYLFQSHWMATEKTKRLSVAFLHATAYGVPFLLLAPSWRAWTFLVLTHALIDRYRVARFVVWGKNHLAPRAHRPPPLVDCKTGYPDDVPDWLAVWLLIVADNTLHLLCNAVALHWL